jgi:hypothetical protein
MPVIIILFFILQINNLKSQAHGNSASASIAAAERDRKIGELESANAALVVNIC